MPFTSLTQENKERIRSEARQYSGLIPESTLEGLLGHACDGRPVGSFLFSVLTNNLMDSFGSADKKNAASMDQITLLVYNVLPRACWGTVEKVNEWRTP